MPEHANDSHGQKLYRALCGILISGRQRHNGNMKSFGKRRLTLIYHRVSLGKIHTKKDLGPSASNHKSQQETRNDSFFSPKCSKISMKEYTIMSQSSWLIQQ